MTSDLTGITNDTLRLKENWTNTAAISQPTLSIRLDNVMDNTKCKRNFHLKY